MRLLIILSAILVCGCSMPRIIVLNDPLNASQHNNLGVSYQQRGEYDIAVREYDSAAELNRAWARPLINRGNVFAALKRWKDATASYCSALKREPRNPEAMNNLAWVLLHSGNTADALGWAKKAVTIDSQEPAYFDTLAEIQIARHDYTAARLAVEKALNLSPEPELRRSLGRKIAELD